MTDPRWTDETEALAAEAYLNRDILSALADAGLLVPPGGEAHTEWTVLPPVAEEIGGRPVIFTSEQDAHNYRRGLHPRRAVHSRIVHVGSWQPSGTTPTGGGEQETG